MPVISINWAYEFAIYLLSSSILILLLSPSLNIITEQIRFEATQSTIASLADTISTMPQGSSFLLPKNLFIYSFTKIYLDGHLIEASYRGLAIHEVKWLLPNKILANDAIYQFKLVGDNISVDEKGDN